MWPFANQRDRTIVVFHIDQDGKAKGAFFRGQADVLIIDDRDKSGRAFQLNQQTPYDELRRRIGKHPLGQQLRPERVLRRRKQSPVLNLHWRTQPEPAL